MWLAAELRIVLMIALGIAGSVTLLGLRRAAEPPVSQRCRLLAGAGCLLVMLALLAQSRRAMHPAVVLMTVGGICLGAWLVSLYQQSLHNTTM